MSTALTTIDPRWQEVLSKIPEALIDPRDYPRIIFALEGVAQCKSWSDICLPGLSKPEYVMLKHRSPEFRSLAKEAETVADEVRQLEREEVAHQRATVGETIPVYTPKGVLAGSYTKASDKLMEVLLRAADPAKYREPKSNGQDAGRVVLNVNFAVPSRVPQIAVIEGEVDDRKQIAGVEKAEGPGAVGPSAPGNPGAGTQGG